ncbi:type II secretion system F family protein [Kribbella solani]|uniref:Flp pilus assembly protein TadB n=1 Tax=Kribbella solani TaxID=236067 RepID=A0A841DMV5_9ACTN|nr:type II secretion system F family protein [Kribbella solani]MBB5979993.1 Flp pilus assembly protein TadB [Kribbella solani]MDX2973712.1 type II secretion system F family protein [Kribbella solani]MDX3007067.1 type II secretion system F family protein [Kribbella solani]
MTLIMLCGAIAGAGLLLVIRLVDRSEPEGAVALLQLDADRRRFRQEVSLTADRRHQTESLRMRRLGASLRRVLDARGIQLPTSVRADLGVTGRSLEAHLASSLTAGLAGFFVPVLLLTPVGVVTGGIPIVVPIWLSLVGVIFGALLPTAQLRSVAADRRRDFRHVVSSFLDLVAMNLAGGRGVPEALSSAAGISDGWAFIRIRDTLETARLQGITPWAALGQLGEELSIDELRDLSTALALVAEDGAKVRESLTARAVSMRRRELAETEGRAQTRSQSMLMAQMLLCVGFLLFLTYPAVARVMGL